MTNQKGVVYYLGDEWRDNREVGLQQSGREGIQGTGGRLHLSDNILHFFLCDISERAEGLDNLQCWIFRWRSQSSSGSELRADIIYFLFEKGNKHITPLLSGLRVGEYGGFEKVVYC